MRKDFGPVAKAPRGKGPRTKRKMRAQRIRLGQMRAPADRTSTSPTRSEIETRPL